MAYNLKDSAQIKVQTGSNEELELELQDGVLPTTTSQLTNDSNFVSDNNYVHTDNNYSDEDKNKVLIIKKGGNANLFLNEFGLYSEGVSGEKGTLWFSVTEDTDILPSGSRVGDFILNGAVVPINIADTEVDAGGFVVINTTNPFNVTLKGVLKGAQGDVGPRGVQGNPGEQGEQGEQGEKGIQGEKGDTVVSLTLGTVQTGDAGTQASIINVGTDTEAILDFVIPRGNKGDSIISRTLTQDEYNKLTEAEKSNGTLYYIVEV